MRSSTSLPVLTEYAEQVALVNWLEFYGFTFTAIPNSTYTPSIRQKVRNKASGLRPGLPDLLVAMPHVGLIFIELKRTKGGVVSSYQKDWITTLNTIPGVEAYVCKGMDAAVAILEPFIKQLPYTAVLVDQF